MLRIAFGLLPGLLVVLAQASWYVQTVIPEAIALRTPTTRIAFELGLEDYPPERFPARYRATVPEGGILPVQVFVNHPGTWNLLLSVSEFQPEAGGPPLPPDRILFRVDRGPWLRGSANPVLFYTGSGPTGGWQELRIEFVLELRGNEPAGAYALNVAITGILGP